MSGSGSSLQHEVLTNQKRHSPALPAAPDKLSLTFRKLPLLCQEIIWDFPS